MSTTYVVGKRRYRRRCIASVVIGGGELRAQCPTDNTCPWTALSELRVVTMPVTNAQCSVTVNVCVRSCPGQPCEVMLRQITFVDVGCLAGVDFASPAMKELFFELAINVASTNAGSPCLAEIPPCSTSTTRQFRFWDAACRMLTSVNENGAQFAPCPNAALCGALFNVCYDYSQTPPALITTMTGAAAIETCGQDYNAGDWVVPSNPSGPTIISCTEWCL